MPPEWEGALLLTADQWLQLEMWANRHRKLLEGQEIREIVKLANCEWSANDYSKALRSTDVDERTMLEITRKTRLTFKVG